MLQASDFTVNGIPADSFMIVSGGAGIPFLLQHVTGSAGRKHDPYCRLRLFLRRWECARIHLHVPLRAVDTNTNTNNNPYFDTETFTDAETGANTKAAPHTSAEAMTPVRLNHRCQHYALQYGISSTPIRHFELP